MENTKKQLAALNADSVRRLVNIVNELEIQKDDIVTFFYQEGSYYLLYYQTLE